MYGAIIGDIAGSRFEFDNGGWTKDFELFARGCEFTDDTVMTIAVAEALLNAGIDADADTLHKELVKSMQDWGHRYPDAGYGNRFIGWLFGGADPQPYNSLGNGSAMRVSAAGWLYDSLERTREVARATAEVTHNHPEGIKGAECTAAVMFLSRTGSAKEDIKDYVIREFGYDLSKTCDEIRPLHKHDETCMDSMPKALISFLEGVDYEDVIRNAISLGGDTDTIAAIAGAMGEAFYGVPTAILEKGASYLPAEIIAVLSRFHEALSGGRGEDPYAANASIALAIEEIIASESDVNYMDLLLSLAERIGEEGVAPSTLQVLEDRSGRRWLPLFTSVSELRAGMPDGDIKPVAIRSILQAGFEDGALAGVVINPFGHPATLAKETINMVFSIYDFGMPE